MARLSREEQRRYEEELEYQRNRPIDIPSRPSAMDRIVNLVKVSSRKLHDVNESPTGKAIRGFAEKVNAQNGLGGGDLIGTQLYDGTRGRAQRAAGRPNPINQQPQQSHGNKVIVEVKIHQPKENETPMKRRGFSGGLGQFDDGFGLKSDRGL